MMRRINFGIFFLILISAINVFAAAEPPVNTEELLKEARRGNEEAYKELGDLYRYGKEGYPKSMINALCFYTLGYPNVTELCGDIYENDPADELGLFFWVLNNLDLEKPEVSKQMLNDSSVPSSPWIAEMRWILDNTKNKKLKKQLENHLKEDRTADEIMMDAVSLSVFYNQKGREELLMVKGITDKVPFFHNVCADMYFKQYRKSEGKDKKSLNEGITALRKAYDKGLLDPYNAKKILSGWLSKEIDMSKVFTPAELEDMREQVKRNDERIEAHWKSNAEAAVEEIEEVEVVEEVEAEE
ncbi:MAG: hypothetical protein K2G23_08850 [Muribaculaceae bacterium]|nr:hypothetical protein [Muribaculaceae bacterium]